MKLPDHYGAEAELKTKPFQMNGKPKHWPGKPLGPPDGRHLKAQFTPEWKGSQGGSVQANPKEMGKQEYRGPDIRISPLRNPATSSHVDSINRRAAPRHGALPRAPRGLRPCDRKTFL